MARVVGVPKEIKDLEGRELFTYLHLAADKGLTEFLMERRDGNLVSAPVAEAHDLPHTSQERVLG